MVKGEGGRTSSHRRASRSEQTTGRLFLTEAQTAIPQQMDSTIDIDPRGKSKEMTPQERGREEESPRGASAERDQGSDGSTADKVYTLVSRTLLYGRKGSKGNIERQCPSKVAFAVVQDLPDSLDDVIKPVLVRSGRAGVQEREGDPVRNLSGREGERGRVRVRLIAEPSSVVVRALAGVTRGARVDDLREPACSCDGVCGRAGRRGVVLLSADVGREGVRVACADGNRTLSESGCHACVALICVKVPIGDEFQSALSVHHHRPHVPPSGLTLQQT